MFRSMARLFTCLSEARGGIKSKLIKKFITILFKRNRKWQFTFSILRLIIPDEDKDRGNYGLKEKALAKLITQCLNLNKAEYERLYHYKNPNYHKEGMGIGDFSICMHDVIKGYLTEKSTLTVRRLNEILDQLANTTDQVKCFRDLIRETNAAEMKWIVRIILKDLKLGIKLETVLTTFHPDANEYHNLTNSLLEICRKFENPKVSLSD
jgi:DNA ligase-4